MALAELMDRRPVLVKQGAGAGPPGNALPGEGPPILSEMDAAPESGQRPESDEYFDKIARLVLELLEGPAGRWVERRSADWPGLLNQAEDIRSLAALGFVQACRAGRIQPDPQTGRHSPASVSAYAFGIVRRLFVNELRARQRSPAAYRPPLESDREDRDEGLDPLHGGGGGVEDDGLWELLRSTKGRCRAEDIVMAFLLASGMSVGELRSLLGVSRNTPANALRRVGAELRRRLGLDNVAGGEG